MRRAILLVVLSVFAVMVLPVVGIGQPTTSHGGTPSDVYAVTGHEGGDPIPCAIPKAKGATTLDLDFTTDVETNIFVSFSYEWASLEGPERAAMYAVLHSTALEPKWLESPGYRTDGSRRGFTAGTLTWMFNDVPAGEQNLGVDVSVGREDGKRPGAYLNGCSLTAFVMPVAV